MNYISFKNHLTELLALSSPILLGNIGQMLIGLGDVYVAGHYNTNTLAAISVASAIFMTLIIAGIGLCSAVTPVLSNYRGEKQPVKKLFMVTVLFSLILAFIFFIGLLLFVPLVYKIGLSPLIVEDCAVYLKISAYSIFGVFLFTALKEFLQAHEIVILPNVIISVSVILNVALNFLFVYGYKFIPEMGTAGLAYASLIVRTLCAVILFVYCARLANRSIYKGTLKYIGDLIKIGAPIAIATFTEFLGFNIVAVIVGKFDPVYAACHNIVIGTTSLAYMIPFSLSNALAVKTGYANGAKDTKEIREYIITSLIFIIFYAITVITIYAAFKKQIMEIFTSDELVIKTGVAIMMIVACFVTFDGIQGVCMGALKGLKQTGQMMLVMILSYVVVSIPLGFVLAFKYNMKLEGFWIGLAFGILCASVVSGTLCIRRYIKLKKIYN